MKKFFKILITIIVLIGIIMGVGGFFATKGLEAGKNVVINGINVSITKDGVYDGKYQAGRWSNEVKVTVKDKKITDIKIVKDVKFVDAKVRENLFKEVIQKQDTKVNVVSGATVTTKAYLKSIENAFANK